MLAALAEGPREPAELAEHLGLQPTLPDLQMLVAKAI
jgi:hypothetical protein